MIDDIVIARITCEKLLEDAKSYAESGQVMRMQHISLLGVDLAYHQFPELKEALKERYEDISRNGYVLATKSALERAETLMNQDNWNEADITLRIIVNLYAPKAGLDVLAEVNKIWESFHHRHKTSSAYQDK